MRVAFLHPDLGLGGAERLIVDAAHGLASKGHAVSVYTSHYDPTHSFAETRDGSFRIIVHADWFPRHFFGMLHILCAYIRMILLTLALCAYGPEYDVFIADQVSVCVPLLRLLRPRSRVLFYGHFPDLLLSTRTSMLKRLYRLPFDLVEEVTTAAAHRIVVNSKFTRDVFMRTFKLMRETPEVLYPCIEVAPRTQP